MSKNINYLNKDFNSFKTKLLSFAKSYYPNTYNDFSESSPGMMLIEMSSYVGDVLSLYLDTQIQETFLPFSKQRKNLLAQSYVLGYTPKITSVSNVILDIYQLIPSTNISGTYYPDFDYSLRIDEGTQIQSSLNSSIKFIIGDKIDFNTSSSLDPTEISVYSTDINDIPDFYLLKKQRKSYSGEIKTSTVDFGDPTRFPTIQLNDDKIIKILEVTDSDNNKWYEVPYLSQDTIFDKIPQTNPIITTPNILKLKKVPRRFTSKFKSDNTLEIQFGPGISTNPDEEIIPNFENIGIGLPYNINKLDVAYDPSNFLYTNSYGLAPYNTTLTIKYITGGGAISNTPSNTLNILHSGNISFINNNIDPILSNNIINSLIFDNSTPAVGGGDGDNNETLKLNTISTFPTQNRAVSSDDYVIRSLSLPSDFGIISHCYVTKGLNNIYDDNLIYLYILSRDVNNHLSIGDDVLKNNLKTYLNDYRALNDSVNILDGFIINIGLNFDIVLRPNYNNQLVINNCLQKLKEYFSISKWSINQPIILSNIYTLLDKVEGVQTVKKIEIYNKSGESNGYSKYGYDIKSATINGIIYPSYDPSIFEIKYPELDIQGRTVNY